MDIGGEETKLLTSYNAMPEVGGPEANIVGTTLTLSGVDNQVAEVGYIEDGTWTPIANTGIDVISTSDNVELEIPLPADMAPDGEFNSIGILATDT